VKRVRKPVPAKEAVKEEAPPKKVYQRLGNDKRLEIISLKERGIEDPEYQATRSAAGRWTVKKRKFPLDQSPRIDNTMQAPATRVTPVFSQPAPAPSVPEPVAPPPQPAPKKDNLDLNWINTQAMVNDSLKKDLELLSDKYDKLAQKEEKRKKAKAKFAQPPPPAAQAPPPKAIPEPASAPRPTQAPVQPQRRGLYRRGKPLNINQF
jgi:hypothetical protein